MKPVPGKFWLFWINWSRASGDRSISAAFQPVSCQRGKGAALHGGRWNSVGKEAIYTAATRSLAALEILVHYSVLPKDFLVTPVRIPDALIDEIELEVLPAAWQANLELTVFIGRSGLGGSDSLFYAFPPALFPLNATTS